MARKCLSGHVVLSTLLKLVILAVTQRGALLMRYQVVVTLQKLLTGITEAKSTQHVTVHDVVIVSATDTANSENMCVCCVCNC